jgi:hypothetical protein
MFCKVLICISSRTLSNPRENINAVLHDLGLNLLAALGFTELLNFKSYYMLFCVSCRTWSTPRRKSPLRCTTCQKYRTQQPNDVLLYILIYNVTLRFLQDLEYYEEKVNAALHDLGIQVLSPSWLYITSCHLTCYSSIPAGSGVPGGEGQCSAARLAAGAGVNTLKACVTWQLEVTWAVLLLICALPKCTECQSVMVVLRMMMKC